jgi:tetratricopeptide (TPR) repeat protein
MADAWGSYSYDPAEDALRVPVSPRPANASERLLFRFDDVTDSTSTLVLHWAEVELPVRLAVNTPEVVLQSMALQLRGRLAFQWDTWDQAAGYALQHRLRLEDALEWTERSAQERPTFQAAITRAAIYDALGESGDAADARRSAMEMAATESELNRSASRMLAARMPAYAVVIAERNVRENPDSWSAHAGLGEALEAAGDRARAAEHYGHARDMAPEDRRANLEAAMERLRGDR